MFFPIDSIALGVVIFPNSLQSNLLKRNNNQEFKKPYKTFVILTLTFRRPVPIASVKLLI